jgi:hypothetical protein
MGGTTAGHFTGKRAGKGEVRAFSEMRRLPLPAYSRRRATEAKERDSARDAFPAGRHHLGRRNRGAFRGTLRLQKSRAMGGAQRDAAGAGLFLAGEFSDHSDR